MCVVSWWMPTTQPILYAKKGKGRFYRAQYPVRRTAQSASHFCPPLADLFIPTPFSASPGSCLATLQLRAKTKSLTFLPLYIARYSFKQLIQLGRQWRERKCPIFETVAKGDSNPDSHYCESGIIPLSYRVQCCTVSCGETEDTSCWAWWVRGRRDLSLFRWVEYPMMSCSRWSCWHARRPNTRVAASRFKAGGAISAYQHE